MQEENETLKEIVSTDSDIKKWLVEYVGEKVQPEDNQVTVEMVIETVADEFPDFLAAVAEENWVRGYQQAINDIVETEKDIHQIATENDE
jgi:hemoglobin-like flavoprotein